MFFYRHRHTTDHNCPETLTTPTISTKAKVHTSYKTNEESKSTNTRKMRGNERVTYITSIYPFIN